MIREHQRQWHIKQFQIHQIFEIKYGTHLCDVKTNIATAKQNVWKDSKSTAEQILQVYEKIDFLLFFFYISLIYKDDLPKKCEFWTPKHFSFSKNKNLHFVKIS